MASSLASPGAFVRDSWQRLSPVPGGRTLFMWLLGRAVPYSRTIGARVEELSPGHARLTLRDRRKVRNHLNSIHAIALANLGEFTSGLALLAGLPEGSRAILVRFSIEFVKKARGTLTSTCNCQVPSPEFAGELRLEPEIADAAGDIVARAMAIWSIRPASAARAA